MSVSICFVRFQYVSVGFNHFCLFLFVSVCFCLFRSVSARFCPFMLSVCFCFSLEMAGNGWKCLPNGSGKTSSPGLVYIIVRNNSKQDITLNPEIFSSSEVTPQTHQDNQF